MKNYKIQVEKEHYNFQKYVHVERWVSYYYQVREVIDLADLLGKKSLTILEIGVGNKITSSVLKQLGHKVKTLDIDPNLKPDYVDTLPDLKVVQGKHFDCVLCFEVLEHIKASDVEIALKNIAQITDNAIISVPNKGFTFSFTFKIWFFQPRSFFLNIPTNFSGHKFNGEHYWELGSKHTSVSWLEKIIKDSGLEIKKNYRLSENPYHRFLVLRKGNRKKIHAVTHWFHPVIAGKEINMLETYSRLVRKGWDITVHTSRSTPTESDSLPHFETYRGIKIIRYPENKLLFIPWTAWDSIESGSYLALHDLELLPHLYLYLFTLFLKLIGKKKHLLIYSSHGLLTINNKAYNSLKFRIKRFIDRYVGVPLINSTADGISDLSKWSAEGLIAAGIKGNNIKVIPNGLVEEAFTANDKNASKKVRLIREKLNKYILQIGRIDLVKNYEMSILAMSKVKEEVSLAIIGPDQDRKYKERLISLIDELGLTRRVHFLGTINGKDKFYLIRHSQMYICSSWSESFSNTTLEAMSQGVPSIVTRGSALGELVKDGINGWSVSQGDDSELAEKIKKILDLEPSKIKKIEHYNHEISKNYTWDRTAELISKFYLSLQEI